MSQPMSGAAASNASAEVAGPVGVARMPPSLIAYLASTNLITGMGFILSIQLVAITAYFLFKSKYRVKIIFINLCFSSLLLILSMTVFVVFISKGLSEPGRWHRNRVSTAAGYFMGFLSMWLCDWTNVFRLALICANEKRRRLFDRTVWPFIAVPVVLKIPRFILPCIAVRGILHFNSHAQPMSASLPQAPMLRPVYWTLTAADQGICTALLAWRLGKAVWGNTLDRLSNHRARRIFHALRCAFYITVISGIVPTCLALVIAFSIYPNESTAHSPVSLKAMIFIYCWINLLATQIAYLTTLIKSKELQQEETPIRQMPDVDVMRDLQHRPSMKTRGRGHQHASSDRFAYSNRRQSRRLLSREVAAIDMHGLSIVEEHQQEQLKPQIEVGEYYSSSNGHGRSHRSKLKSLLENLGLSQPPSSAQHGSASKRKANGGYDNRVYSAPEAKALEGCNFHDDMGDLGILPRHSVVATIGCPMDLEPKQDFWNQPLDQTISADGIEVYPPPAPPPVQTQVTHSHAPAVNVANTKIFCLPPMMDYPEFYTGLEGARAGPSTFGAPKTSKKQLQRDDMDESQVSTGLYRPKISVSESTIGPL